MYLSRSCNSPILGLLKPVVPSHQRLASGISRTTSKSGRNLCSWLQTFSVSSSRFGACWDFGRRELDITIRWVIYRFVKVVRH